MTDLSTYSSDPSVDLVQLASVHFENLAKNRFNLAANQGGADRESPNWASINSTQ